MKILLATDGSAHAEVAHALVASLRWPALSTIRIVRATEPIFAMAGLTDAQRNALATAFVSDAEAQLEATASALAARDRRVERVVLRGGPGAAVVEEARRFGADLIVVGGRRLGPVGTALLGSTSSEVVDRASCPVLVARRPLLRSAILAEDGSPGARQASNVVRSWPIFHGLPVSVVSVASVQVPLASGVAPTMRHASAAAYHEALEEARAVHGSLASETAASLRAAGVAAQASVREGDPVVELLAAAASADLIVMGSRGHRGLARVVLGSVAHALVTRAPTSVLIVRTGRL